MGAPWLPGGHWGGGAGSGDMFGCNDGGAGVQVAASGEQRPGGRSGATGQRTAPLPEQQLRTR